MRISELARSTGVPVATVKFYLREGLLPEGRRTSATQAQYDAEHVARLRLVRALLGVGGLSVAQARDVVRELEYPTASTHDLLGVAQALSAVPPPAEVDLAPAEELIARWGWRIDPKDRDSVGRLAEALLALEHAGFRPPEGILDVYAEACAGIAAAELDAVPQGSLSEAVRYVVLGTVLMEPVLLALRRLAEQDASYRRFAAQGEA